ncbi:MAG: hypothetical protein LC113_11610 [Acidobacteria bacterium]|nr:hypothetical protein [Acidobacteriota bacterium]
MQKTVGSEDGEDQLTYLKETAKAGPFPKIFFFLLRRFGHCWEFLYLAAEILSRIEKGDGKPKNTFLHRRARRRRQLCLLPSTLEPPSIVRG